MRSTFICVSVIFVTVSILSATENNARAGLVISDSVDSTYDEWLEKAEKGKTGKFAGVHYYWKDGLHMDSRNNKFRLKIGGTMMIDTGNIEADDELQTDFPDLEGYETDFRQLSVDGTGAIYHDTTFKFEIDFANIREIKDNWIRFKHIPYLGYLKIGNMKEPFSLEALTSSKYITYMEDSLPTKAMKPGRNIGILLQDTVMNHRMTWNVGGFLNTGSSSSLGDASDQISEANGFDLTARATGLAWHANDGERFMHIGLSYSHRFRDGTEDEGVRFRTRPESRLTDDRLVDTGSFSATGVDLINPELAIVSGPFALQGEYFVAFTDANSVGDPLFRGFYVSVSYFITGEHRHYDTSNGVFSRIRQKHKFRPLKAEWGAWELGARYSYIDLNDEKIRGGKENNFSVGVNGYLNPNARIMFNYIHVNVEDRASPAIDDGRANILQARFQIAF